MGIVTRRGIEGYKGLSRMRRGRKGTFSSGTLAEIWVTR